MQGNKELFFRFYSPITLSFLSVLIVVQLYSLEAVVRVTRKRSSDISHCSICIVGEQLNGFL